MTDAEIYLASLGMPETPERATCQKTVQGWDSSRRRAARAELKALGIYLPPMRRTRVVVESELPLTAIVRSHG